MTGANRHTPLHLLLAMRGLAVMCKRYLWLLNAKRYDY